LLALHGLCLSFMGKYREGARDLESALVGARNAGAPEGLLVAHLFRALGANVTGDIDDALPNAHAALRIAVELRHPFFEPIALAMLGIAQIFDGRWQEGTQVLEELLEGDLGGMGVLIEPYVRTCLSMAHLEAGDFERARECAAKAVILAIERDTKMVECFTQLGIARVTLRVEGAAGRATVQKALERSAELVEETGAYSLKPRIHIERAALALALGDLPTRQREVERALQLAATMGVRLYAPELNLDKVP
jgi:tetratricopeptide (TPR) repeat protein